MTGETLAPALPATLGVKRVLVIGTGAIAVCHLPNFVTLLRDYYRVDTAVCLTASAREFVSPMSLGALSGQPVIPPYWSENSGPSHVRWAEWAEAVIVWPATLNFLSRCATGTANDVPSAIVLSTRAPVLFAPSLASGMVEGGPFKRAAELLKTDGHGIVGPVAGHAVSNWKVSPGGCAPPDLVLRALADLLGQSRSNVSSSTMSSSTMSNSNTSSSRKEHHG